MQELKYKDKYTEGQKKRFLGQWWPLNYKMIVWWPVLYSFQMILFYLVRYVLVEPAVQEGVDTGGAHGGEVDAEEGEEVKPDSVDDLKWVKK